ncbi:aldo/keto reductase [Candidatus Mycoplasma haematobovis]|uniref:Aldo/keto reductase n=1 Tax=Candidatus Mycoplasma haematobovis TaxID=432608 RepID=A0A1A9QCF9_9MOLU|nr:aldo/keto reductase [Candidatus Mycoplasma haematobovis]OAL10157.1 aldo/keto reductase [Candidatus Mycoplasma haematobovis]
MRKFVYDPSTARIGLGTNIYREQEPLTGILIEVVKHDYDFIDCAWRYGNEAIIGITIKAIKKENPSFEFTIPFQSKVWPTQFNGGIMKSLKFSLSKIGTSSIIDSYMLHRPIQEMKLNLIAWKQLIDCRKNRLTKQIGLGHFDKDLIEKLYENTGVRPQFLQIELSVNNMRWDRIHYCREHDIDIQAYEPLGDYLSNSQNATLISLAQKYNTTIKNLLLAYLLNQGITPVVTPETVEEIKEFPLAKNIILEAEDIEVMNSINTYKNKHFESLELDFREDII